MSFMKPQDIIKENDTVILYLKVNSMHTIEATPTIINKNGVEIEHIYQTTYGALKVRDLIGVPYGSRVKLSKGWAYVLQPNPELWTLTLPHRTQIIYTPDISMILFQLEVCPGSIVIESGTGSGSLSHYFLRALKPNGHLHTFDFHEARVQQASDEFKKHGLSDFVTTYHRDVINDGFCAEVNNKADAIFLDLPSPHLAVPHAVKAFKNKGGRFCSFSPCVEQSQRCSIALEEYGFVDIVSIEILQQEHIVKTKFVPTIELGFLKHKKTTDVEDETIVNAEVKKKQKEGVKITTTFLPTTSPGHTGYLTFATLPSSFVRPTKQ